MLAGSNVSQVVFVIFIFCMTVCFPCASFCLDTLKGEVTANVKLRRSPGLDGKVLTVLDKGDRIVIQEKNGEWLRVPWNRTIWV